MTTLRAGWDIFISALWLAASWAMFRGRLIHGVIKSKYLYLIGASIFFLAGLMLFFGGPFAYAGLVAMFLGLLVMEMSARRR